MIKDLKLVFDWFNVFCVPDWGCKLSRNEKHMLEWGGRESSNTY